jgi:hypothetical protein
MFKKLFGKSTSGKKPTEPVIPKEIFSFFKLTIDGSLAFAMINKGYENYPNKEFYPWYAVVLIEIHDKNKNGHPTSEEAVILNDLEDKITQFLNETQITHKIGRITKNGQREIIFYLTNPRLDQTRAQSFFDSINSVRPMNFTVEKDERWRNVGGFIK